MVLDKHHHIFKVEKESASGMDYIVGYYFAESKSEVEDYLRRNDVDFDRVVVIPIVDIVEADKVCGAYGGNLMRLIRRLKS